MSDLISRQAAIDEANAWLLDCFHVQKQDRSCGLIRRLEDLPSAQTEIIRCKDCKHWKPQVKGVNGDGLGGCNFHKANFVTGEGFCYWAERRINE